MTASGDNPPVHASDDAVTPEEALFYYWSKAV
jgi:hypothetical protein